MRAVRALAGGFSVDQPWMPGVPHGLAALAMVLVFDGRACLTGLMFATLASFVVFLPLTALTLNGGRAMAENEPAPVLSARVRLMLLGLWTLTAWGTAAVAMLAARG